MRVALPFAAMSEKSRDRKPGPPASHGELLRDLDQIIAASGTDERTRQEILKLRAEVDTPEMRALDAGARKTSAKAARPRKVRFRDYTYPQWLMLPVVGGLALVFAIFFASERNLSLAIPLAISGGLGIWLSTRNRFVVTFGGGELRAEKVGDRWAMLRTGSIPTLEIESTRERLHERVLEVHGTSGEMIEIPMSVWNYSFLERILTRLARRGSRRS